MKKKSLILKFKKMKKQILTLVIAFLSFVGYAQVGVGTSNPTLTLEVVGTNDNGAVTGVDGVLVPRVNDTDMSSATAGTKDGQMVYNTVAKKFYYWNGTAWTAVGEPAISSIVATSLTPTYTNETIIIDNNTSNHNFTLPNPSSAFYANKIIYYRNNSFAAGGVGTTTFLTHVPDSNSTCIQSRGLVLFSDSTNWYVIGGF